MVEAAKARGITLSELARKAIEKAIDKEVSLEYNAPRCPICNGLLAQDGRLIRCTSCNARFILHEKSDAVMPFVDKEVLYTHASGKCGESIYKIAWEYISKTGNPSPGYYDIIISMLWELYREGRIDIQCFGIECYIVCRSE